MRPDIVQQRTCARKVAEETDICMVASRRIGRKLARAHWILSAQFGLDPIVALKAFLGLPRYARDLVRMRGQYGGRLEIQPCLHDWNVESGTTRSEYFLQDLIVAREIFLANPVLHVDVGSRVDGFVAHVASFREIEVLDVRPTTTPQLPGIKFVQRDLTKPIEDADGYCDSLSCLHALEHFGLGRYGDTLDVAGHERGIANMARLLRQGGRFYLSTPIGTERIAFNANRVFAPTTIVNLALRNSLELTSLVAVHKNGVVESECATAEKLLGLSRLSYALGIFTFTKKSAHP